MATLANKYTHHVDSAVAIILLYLLILCLSIFFFFFGEFQNELQIPCPL